MHSLQELSDSNGRKNGENFDFQSYFRTANLFLEHEMFQVKMTPDKIDVSRSEGVVFSIKLQNDVIPFHWFAFCSINTFLGA